MAGLRKCKACGKSVSDIAPICPHCGEDFQARAELEKENKRNVRWCCCQIIVILGVIAFFYFISK
jgi:predicted amidophosphoribosyltransferase